MAKNQALEYPIVLDYSRPVTEVCKKVMHYSFSRSQSLDMICRPWAPREMPENTVLPSWTQTTKKSAFGPASNGTYVRINADPFVGEPALGRGSYNATPDVLPRWKIDEDGHNVLSALGFILDEIHHKARWYHTCGMERTCWMGRYERASTGRILENLGWQSRQSRTATAETVAPSVSNCIQQEAPGRTFERRKGAR